MSYFVNQNIILIKDYFNEYINKLNYKNNSIKDIFSINNDKISFLKEIKLDGNNFNKIIQLQKESNDIIYDICSKSLML